MSELELELRELRIEWPETPDLAAAVLRDNVVQRAAIKKMVKQWRADEFRV